MAWIIRDADWFIEYTNGKFGVTRSPKKATQFKSQTVCENVITSSLSKKLKDGHNWESCFVEEPQPKEVQPRETEPQPQESKESQSVQEVTHWMLKGETGYFSFKGDGVNLNADAEEAFQFKNKENCEKVLRALNHFEQNWTIVSQVTKQKLKTLNKDLRKAEQYHVDAQYGSEFSQLNEFMLRLVTMCTVLEEEYSNLQEQQAVIDAEIVDFQHAIEFYDLNAAEGFRAYKDLQQVLRKKRKIKNDLLKAAVLRNTCLNENTVTTMQSAFPMTNQYHYVPRVLTGIFRKE